MPVPAVALCRLLKAGGDAAVGGRDLGAERRDRGDDRKRDQQSQEGIFDRGGAALVAAELPKNGHRCRIQQRNGETVWRRPRPEPEPPSPRRLTSAGSTPP